MGIISKLFGLSLEASISSDEKIRDEILNGLINKQILMSRPMCYHNKLFEDRIKQLAINGKCEVRTLTKKKFKNK